MYYLALSRAARKCTAPAVVQRVELKASRVVHVGACDNAAGKYALAKKKMSYEYLRNLMHLRPRTNVIGCAAGCLCACMHLCICFVFTCLHLPRTQPGMTACPYCLQCLHAVYNDPRCRRSSGTHSLQQIGACEDKRKLRRAVQGSGAHTQRAGARDARLLPVARLPVRAHAHHHHLRLRGRRRDVPGARCGWQALPRVPALLPSSSIRHVALHISSTHMNALLNCG